MESHSDISALYRDNDTFDEHTVVSYRYYHNRRHYGMGTGMYLQHKAYLLRQIDRWHPRVSK